MRNNVTEYEFLTVPQFTIGMVDEVMSFFEKGAVRRAILGNVSPEAETELRARFCCGTLVEFFAGSIPTDRTWKLYGGVIELAC